MSNPASPALCVAHHDLLCCLLLLCAPAYCSIHPSDAACRYHPSLPSAAVGCMLLSAQSPLSFLAGPVPSPCIPCCLLAYLLLLRCLLYRRCLPSVPAIRCCCYCPPHSVPPAVCPRLPVAQRSPAAACHCPNTCCPLLPPTAPLSAAPLLLPTLLFAPTYLLTCCSTAVPATRCLCSPNCCLLPYCRCSVVCHSAA
jgi:hypothetical protein